MTELTDHELLAEFAGAKSEAAFATLVARHLNLVYSAALRFSGNPHHTEEITQAVFIILARKAGTLSRGVVLSGWLYQTARLTAANFVKGEIRRQHREQEAYMQSTLDQPGPSRRGETEAEAWQNIAPLLDEAMGELGETDRNAVVLRFFENKTAQEVGAALRLSEAAAHKRVNRALEKLRKIFTRRGVTFSAMAIAAAVSANSVQAAPPGLGATISAMAVTGSAVAASTLTLAKGAMKLMAWTKINTAAAVGAAVLLTATTATVAVKVLHANRPQPDIQGAWEGVLQVAGKDQLSALVTKVRVVLRVSGTNGSYHATLDGIETRVKDIPISQFVYDYPSLRFKRPPYQTDSTTGVFDGKLNPAADEISGAWTWNPPGTTASLALKRTTTPDLVPGLMAESDYTARPGSDLQGYWKGTLNVGNLSLRTVFKISELAGGKFIAEMESLDQGSKNFVVSSVTYDKPDVRLEIGLIGAVFQGRLSPNEAKITGTFTQARVPLPLTLERGDPKTGQAEAAAEAARDASKDYSYASPNDLTGHWKGTLDVKGVKLHLALHVAQLPDGAFSGSLDSIDQGARNIAANVVRFAATEAHLEWNALGVTYDGKLQGGKISGTFRQAGLELPLVFERSAGD